MAFRCHYADCIADTPPRLRCRRAAAITTPLLRHFRLHLLIATPLSFHYWLMLAFSCIIAFFDTPLRRRFLPPYAAISPPLYFID